MMVRDVPLEAVEIYVRAADQHAELSALHPVRQRSDQGGRRRRAGGLDAEVDALATRFASGLTRGLARIKAMIRESWGQSLDAALDRQRDAMRELGSTSDYREGVAAFMEKRKPTFTGK